MTHETESAATEPAPPSIDRVRSALVGAALLLVAGAL